jgi:plastocyanin
MLLRGPKANRFGVVTALAVAYVHVPARTVSVQQPLGRLEGRVTFSGAPPSPTMLTEDGDPQPVLYLDRSGGLRYTVVYLPDATRSSTPPPPPVTMNQRRFMFEPQVLAVRAGQTVWFTNDDPANHSVRTEDSNPANTFSINTAAGGLSRYFHQFAPTPSGDALKLSCDIHPWMAAWIYVFGHDRFAVTSEDGRFVIQGVPPGRYRIAVRQPAGGLARDLAVTIRAGSPTRLHVRFTPADVRMPAR